jgi:O-antigen biosynthesis protein WbqP
VFISIAFISPIFILIAMLIAFFDPGPIFFKQERLGKNGIGFLFYKFRSMPVDTGNLPSDKVGRVKLTWIGKLIRRTNLDELPQLLNILKGDMSVVGPRPPIPSQTELIDLRKKNGSLECVPGLTGLAQVKAFDGMTISQKAKYDGEYSKRVTFISDLKIILSTFIYLLKPPPIY